MNTPVVITAFNRPDCCLLLYRALEKVKPKRLYVISDAARTDVDGENSLVESSRRIFQRVSWECELLPLYSIDNEGPRDRIINGLNEVFLKEEMAIILEHDCIPDQSFFEYAECLLNKYKNDERVMNISGMRMFPNNIIIDEDYTFSKYIPSWGWATWKRAWRQNDSALSSLKVAIETNALQNVFSNTREYKYWKWLLGLVQKNQKLTWDYIWWYSCWMQNGLCVHPKVNMIKNIGAGERAENTVALPYYVPTKYNACSKPLKHPPFVLPNIKVDQWFCDYVYSKSFSGRIQWLLDKGSYPNMTRIWDTIIRN